MMPNRTNSGSQAKFPGPAPRTVSKETVSKRTGLTVLELLITMSIIGLLMAILLPAVHTAREAARRTQCKNNLRQLGVALQMHHDTFLTLPAGWSVIPGTPAASGWIPALLPFLEQANLAEEVKLVWPARMLESDHAAIPSSPNTAERMVDHVLKTSSIFSCPSDSADSTFLLFAEEENDAFRDVLSDTVLMELPHSNYVGVSGISDPDELRSPAGEGTLIRQQKFCFRDLTRGLSNVAVVSERTARRLASTWLGFHMAGEDAPGRVVGFSSLGPNQPKADECEFDSRHPGCVQSLFADGHVEAVADQIDQEVYQVMAKRNE